MPRPSARQPRRERVVLSLSIPVDPDYARACRAAAMNDESLSAWIRESMRQRANRQFGKDDQRLNGATASGEPQDQQKASDRVAAA